MSNHHCHCTSIYCADFLKSIFLICSEFTLSNFPNRIFLIDYHFLSFWQFSDSQCFGSVHFQKIFKLQINPFQYCQRVFRTNMFPIFILFIKLLQKLRICLYMFPVFFRDNWQNGQIINIQQSILRNKSMKTLSPALVPSQPVNLYMLDPFQKLTPQFAALRNQLNRNKILFKTLVGFDEAKKLMNEKKIKNMIVVNSSNLGKNEFPREIFTTNNNQLYFYPAKYQDQPNLPSIPSVIDKFYALSGGAPSTNNNISLRSIKKDVYKQTSRTKRQYYDNIILMRPKNQNSKYEALMSVLQSNKKISFINSQSQLQNFKDKGNLMILDKDQYDRVDKYLFTQHMLGSVDVAVLGYMKGFKGKKNGAIMTEHPLEIIQYLQEAGLPLTGVKQRLMTKLGMSQINGANNLNIIGDSYKGGNQLHQQSNNHDNFQPNTTPSFNGPEVYNNNIQLNKNNIDLIEQGETVTYNNKMQNNMPLISKMSQTSNNNKNQGANQIKKAKRIKTPQNKSSQNSPTYSVPRTPPLQSEGQQINSPAINVHTVASSPSQSQGNINSNRESQKLLISPSKKPVEQGKMKPDKETMEWQLNYDINQHSPLGKWAKFSTNMKNPIGSSNTLIRQVTNLSSPEKNQTQSTRNLVPTPPKYNQIPAPQQRQGSETRKEQSIQSVPNYSKQSNNSIQSSQSMSQQQQQRLRNHNLKIGDKINKKYLKAGPIGQLSEEYRNSAIGIGQQIFASNGNTINTINSLQGRRTLTYSNTYESDINRRYSSNEKDTFLNANTKQIIQSASAPIKTYELQINENPSNTQSSPLRRIVRQTVSPQTFQPNTQNTLRTITSQKSLNNAGSVSNNSMDTQKIIQQNTNKLYSNVIGQQTGSLNSTANFGTVKITPSVAPETVRYTSDSSKNTYNPNSNTTNNANANVLSSYVGSNGNIVYSSNINSNRVINGQSSTNTITNTYHTNNNGNTSSFRYADKPTQIKQTINTITSTPYSYSANTYDINNNTNNNNDKYTYNYANAYNTTLLSNSRTKTTQPQKNTNITPNNNMNINASNSMSYSSYSNNITKNPNNATINNMSNNSSHTSSLNNSLTNIIKSTQLPTYTTNNNNAATVTYNRTSTSTNNNNGTTNVATSNLSNTTTNSNLTNIINTFTTSPNVKNYMAGIGINEDNYEIVIDQDGRKTYKLKSATTSSNPNPLERYKSAPKISSTSNLSPKQTSNVFNFDDYDENIGENGKVYYTLKKTMNSPQQAVSPRTNIMSNESSQKLLIQSKAGEYNKQSSVTSAFNSPRQLATTVAANNNSVNRPNEDYADRYRYSPNPKQNAYTTYSNTNTNTNYNTNNNNSNSYNYNTNANVSSPYKYTTTTTNTVNNQVKTEVRTVKQDPRTSYRSQNYSQKYTINPSNTDSNGVTRYTTSNTYPSSPAINSIKNAYNYIHTSESSMSGDHIIKPVDSHTKLYEDHETKQQNGKYYSSNKRYSETPNVVTAQISSKQVGPNSIKEVYEYQSTGKMELFNNSKPQKQSDIYKYSGFKEQVRPSIDFRADKQTNLYTYDYEYKNQGNTHTIKQYENEPQTPYYQKSNQPGYTFDNISNNYEDNYQHNVLSYSDKPKIFIQKPHKGVEKIIESKLPGTYDIEYFTNPSEIKQKSRDNFVLLHRQADNIGQNFSRDLGTLILLGGKKGDRIPSGTVNIPTVSELIQSIL